MANDYSTLASVKELLPLNAWTSAYETVVTSLLTRASRLIDEYYPDREPGAFAVSSTSARYFDGSGKMKLWIDELAAAPESVAVAETGDIDDSINTGGTYTAWDASDYILWPYNALAKKMPVQRLDIDALNGSKSVWYSFPKSVKIAGYWGFATTTNTPDTIVHACEAQVLRMFGESQQKYADVGAIPQLNQLKYAKALHPEVKMILDAAQFQQLGGLF